mgnify:CR=1 FL=1
MLVVRKKYGYFDEYPAKLAEKFQSLGGEILFNSEVEKIVVEKNAVKGIRLKGHEGMIRAEKLITTVDPKLAMRQLLGDEHLPVKYIKKLDRWHMPKIVEFLQNLVCCRPLRDWRKMFQFLNCIWK